jgi:hypothetical protein
MRLRIFFPCLIAAALWVVALATAGSAEARRVALVIGNSDYGIGPLRNPVGDAEAVAQTLDKKLGFDTVILKRNLTSEGFRTALLEFARAATGAEVGLVYFAGHGTETGGRNFLIPVDAKLARASDLDLEAIGLDTVIAQLAGVTSLKIVILDACRNSLFPLSGLKRSTGRGLARIEPAGNTLVAYAAKDGTTADDGVGLHSPFTAALLKHLATPGLEIRQLFGFVRDDVEAATSHQQEPYLYGSLGGKGMFLVPVPPVPPVVPTIGAPLPPPVVPAPAPTPQLSEIERAWALAKDTSAIAVLEAFRKQYGASNALFDRLAQERIDALKAAEAKKAAEAGQKAAMAFPPPPTAAPTPTPPAPPDLARRLQVELQRVGCDPGYIDGVWGDKGEAALQRFARYAKLGLSTDQPTLAALDAVKGQAVRICPLECGPNTVERNGACVAKAAPDREPPRAKPYRNTQKAYERPAPAPKAPRYRPESKPSMCWAVEGRTMTIVPCSDPRAGTRAY